MSAQLLRDPPQPASARSINRAIAHVAYFSCRDVHAY